MRSGYVGKDEPVAIDHLTDLDDHRMGEHRAVPRKGVKLTALAAAIDAGWKIVEQRAIELTARERSMQMFRIDTRQHRSQATFHHPLRELTGGDAPDREHR